MHRFQSFMTPSDDRSTSQNSVVSENGLVSLGMECQTIDLFTILLSCLVSLD